MADTEQWPLRAAMQPTVGLHNASHGRTVSLNINRLTCKKKTKFSESLLLCQVNCYDYGISFYVWRGLSGGTHKTLGRH